MKLNPGDMVSHKLFSHRNLGIITEISKGLERGFIMYYNADGLRLAYLENLTLIKKACNLSRLIINSEKQ